MTPIRNGVFFLTLLFIFISEALAVVADRVRIAEPDAWIDRTETFDLKAPNSPDAKGGFDVLLSDDQIAVEEQARYSHYAYRITTTDGVQRGSHVSVDYDPEYESIDFHQVRIIRDGASLDRLVLSEIKSLQQEKELERYQYNGQLTALLMLSDVRMGDVVEVAYTRRGRNPIFGDHFSTQSIISTVSPAHHRRIRVIAAAGRKLFTKTIAGTPVVIRTSESGGKTELVWRAEHQAAVQVDADCPYGFYPFPYLQVSDYPDWRSVVQWALPLYQLPDPIPEAIVEKVEALTAKSSSQEEEALSILRFVQDEVRYLGVEMGTHSHRPNPPDLVFERRYGDCKDKVMLLCAMLRYRGIRAVPVLTHTARRNHIKEFLPDPSAFNHVIARIDLLEGSYFVDPTQTNQSGRLKYRALPEYGWALPLEKETKGLVPVIVEETAKAALNTHENYVINEYGKQVTLSVKSVSYGLWADHARAYLKQTPQAEVEKYYLNNRLRLYPKISMSAPMKWESNERTNTITVSTSYVIDDIWQGAAGTTRKSAEFYPMAIRDYLQAPNSLSRTMPLGLAYPLNITYRSSIHTPGTQQTSVDSHTIESDVMRASYSSSFVGNTVEQEVTLIHKTDEIPASQVSDYAAKQRELRQSIGYTISYDPEVMARNLSFRLNWMLVVFSVLVLGGSVYLMWRLYHWPLANPVPNLSHQKLEGLGGWLILVGFGTVLRPFVLLVSISKMGKTYLDGRVWDNFTQTGSSLYKPGFGTLVLLEIGFNILIMTLGFSLILMFFKKRKMFPLLFVISLVAMTIVSAVDLLAVSIVMKQSFDLPKEFWQLLGASVVWIPYMLSSKRVMATFVNGPDRPAPKQEELKPGEYRI